MLSRTHITLVEREGISVDGTKLGFFTTIGLCNYLGGMIGEGRPVWVALPNANHVVLVVGASSAGIRIHDPSGELIDKAREKVKKILKDKSDLY